MASYVVNTKKQQQTMLDEINQSMDDLLSYIPNNVRLTRAFDLPKDIAPFPPPPCICRMK